MSISKSDRITPQQPTGWQVLLRPGNLTFLGTLLIVTFLVLGTAYLAPMFAFLLGSGWMAPLMTAVLLFSMIVLFKNLIFKYFYPKSSPDGEAELIEYLVRENASGHPDEEIETELLENALHLKKLKVRDCMTPRREIVAVDIRDNLTEVRGLFVESNLSRIIVTDGDLDNVVGYLHVQQLFSSPKNLRSVVLPIAFVPAAMAVDDLLQKFIRSRSSIACVVDEYGGVNGLVTLEDALEQLFGDIDDEHDQEEFIETKVAENEYLFSGRLDINYLNEAYPEISLPEGEYHTLSGYIIHETQNIPEQSEKIELNGITFLIELVSDRKIETVRVLLPAAN